MGRSMFHKDAEPDINLPTSLTLIKHTINSMGLLSVVTEYYLTKPIHTKTIKSEYNTKTAT